MRRVDRLALAALGLTGCMRIYPDPELPDVTVLWGEQDCRDGTGNVAITLTGVDTPSTATTTVPCTDHTVAFPMSHASASTSRARSSILPATCSARRRATSICATASTRRPGCT
ncbi:MAG: hypothetical protein IPQ07_37305 [Myxococcales bacterium]|nr:hypothetical protein [Myxococcales bacterium]